MRSLQHATSSVTSSSTYVVNALSVEKANMLDTAALIRLVEHLQAGTNPLDRVRVRTLPNGQVALRVFPAVVQDRVLAGYTADVWLRPRVTLEQATAGVARRLRDTNLPGQVSLVLGAGNINSIPPLDGLAKLYQDNAVALIKLNPINAYLEPVLNRAFAPFVERGFVRITAGGVDVGSYLVRHPEVDSIHITGNSASHDAVVFGPGEEGARRKQAREPLITKPITSELGGVGPAVVVPGRWRDAALRLQAQNVATQRLHNSGFNCIATQIVVLPQNWPQADRFLDYLRQALRAVPPTTPVRPTGNAGPSRRIQRPSCSAATRTCRGPCCPTCTPTTRVSPPSVPSISVQC